MTAQQSIPPARHAHDVQMSVDGWEYYIATDEDDDVRKISHYLIHEGTGRAVEVNWNPYERMTAPDIKRMVEMGFPKHPSLKRADGRPMHAPFRSDTCELEWYRRKADGGYGLTPNHWPPGKAVSRFLNLRTGGNLPRQRGMGMGGVALFALAVLIILSIFTYG